MAEFKKFRPCEVLQSGLGTPPKAAKVSKLGQTLGGLGVLGGVEGHVRFNRKVFEVAPDEWSEGEDERAAIIEHDGGAPRAWAEALARLDPAAPPAGIPLSRWVQFVNDCGHFVDDRWTTRAHALGWTPLELFGCNRRRRVDRFDKSGLLWQIDGARLILLSANTAIAETTDGIRRKYARLAGRSGLVIAWHLV